MAPQYFDLNVHDWLEVLNSRLSQEGLKIEDLPDADETDFLLVLADLGFDNALHRTKLRKVVREIQHGPEDDESVEEETLADLLPTTAAASTAATGRPRSSSASPRRRRMSRSHSSLSQSNLEVGDDTDDFAACKDRERCILDGLETPKALPQLPTPACYDQSSRKAATPEGLDTVDSGVSFPLTPPQQHTPSWRDRRPPIKWRETCELDCLAKEAVQDAVKEAVPTERGDNVSSWSSQALKALAQDQLAAACTAVPTRSTLGSPLGSLGLSEAFGTTYSTTGLDDPQGLSPSRHLQTSSSTQGLSPSRTLQASTSAQVLSPSRLVQGSPSAQALHSGYQPQTSTALAPSTSVERLGGLLAAAAGGSRLPLGANSQAAGTAPARRQVITCTRGGARPMVVAAAPPPAQATARRGIGVLGPIIATAAAPVRRVRSNSPLHVGLSPNRCKASALSPAAQMLSPSAAATTTWTVHQGPISPTAGGSSVSLRMAYAISPEVTGLNAGDSPARRLL